jgi:hypothetical protein
MISQLPPTGITSDGNVMTLISSSLLAMSNLYKTIYYILNPETSQSLTVTFPSAVIHHGIGLSFSNVDQLTPFSFYDHDEANVVTSITIAEPIGGGTYTNYSSTLAPRNVDNLNVGNLTNSEDGLLDVYSTSRFRTNITTLNSSVTIDGLNISGVTPYISNFCISGYTHTHSPFSIISGEIIKLSPKFYGAVTTSTKFKNNIDLDPTTFKPTLKHENISYPEDYWIRTFVPAGCNQLESIIIEHKITNGSNVDVLIYDCLGAELEPSDGSRLVASTSLRTTIISGIDQDGFTQRQPFDIKLTFNTSGTGIHYIGDITMNFIGNSGN